MAIRYIDEPPQKSKVRYLDDSKPQPLQAQKSATKDNRSILSKIPIVGDVARPLESIADSAVDYGAQAIHGNFKPNDQVKGDFKSALSGALSAAPMFVSGGASIPAKIGIQALANAIGSGSSSLVNGKSFGDSAKDALSSGVGAGAIQGALPFAGKAASLLKGPAANAMSIIGEILSSVPRSSYLNASKSALDGKASQFFGEGTGFLGKILGSSDSQDKELAAELADKARAAGTAFRRDAGSAVGAAKNDIKDQFKTGDYPVFDRTDVLSGIKNAIDSQKTSVGNSAISPSDYELIDRYRLELSQKNLPIDEANRIKNEINDKLYSSKRANGRLSVGEGVLSQVAHAIDNQIQEKAPDLFSANKKTAEAIRLSDFINTKLNDPNNKGVSLLSNIRTQKPLFKALQTADEAAPDVSMDDLSAMDRSAPAGSKFLDEAQRIIDRAPFRAIMPGQGGGSGSAQGALNFTRVGGVLGLAGKGEPIAAGALGALESPFMHKIALQGLSGAINTAKPFSPLVKKLAPYIGAKKSEQYFGSGSY